MDFNKKYCDGFFDVNEINGFLPIRDPLDKLPEDFSELQKIVENIPELLKSVDYNVIVKNIPDYTNLIDKYEDIFIIQALFRSYAFITSSYLLQPAHINKTESGYGKARTVLPKNIALPLEKVSKILEIYPYMDYHYGYSSGNYKRIDKSRKLDLDNLDTICKFSSTSDEKGFIMTHVNINQYSSSIILGIKFFTAGDKTNGLLTLLEAMTNINRIRTQMWKVSDPKKYNDYRAFIMGIKGNVEIFGDGVIYEGSEDLSLRQYRGQTGAQDDVIPTMDIFTGVINYYPKNELTKYLYDLRTYRPKVIQQFLKDLEQFTIDYTVLDENEKQHLCNVLEQIYDFRNGHWKFVHEYIMKNTKYQIATGGTPIISWIPNQIGAVLQYMGDVLNSMDQTSAFVQLCLDNLALRQKILDKQLDNLKKDYCTEQINKSSCCFVKD
jgi:indoleamine 2,3-dioxygenase